MILFYILKKWIIFNSSVDIASYITQEYAKRGILFNPHRLQRFVYICNGFHLALFNKPLVADRPMCLKNGPIFSKLYGHLKDYKLELVSNFKFSRYYLNDKQKDLINHCVDNLMNKSDNYLHNIVTLSGTPWAMENEDFLEKRINGRSYKDHLNANWQNKDYTSVQKIDSERHVTYIDNKYIKNYYSNIIHDGFFKEIRIEYRNSDDKKIIKYHRLLNGITINTGYSDFAKILELYNIKEDSINWNEICDLNLGKRDTIKYNGKNEISLDIWNNYDIKRKIYGK